jgi:8-amino-7-oxononanoate synthase
MNDRSSHESLDWIDGELADLERRGLRRRLVDRVGAQGAMVRLDGQELINFSTNDYLGLAADPRLTRAVRAALDDQGWGAGASPLISGHSDLHRQLEERLAQFEQAEAALVFSSGFAANAGTIAALVGPGDVVFTDRKNHASLLDGCRLSRADVRVYRHGDSDQLNRRLKRYSGHNRRLIVTDSLFSMDGDVAPLFHLAEVADRHGAMLMIDEAHATGVFGASGRGIAEAQEVEPRIPVRVGTLSKALGSHGGYVVGERRLIDWLVNRARPYVFSTAAPAAVAAASLAALDVVITEPERRVILLERAAELRHRLAGLGWNVGNSVSQIIPIVVGEADSAVRLSASLRQKGLLVPAIRPPTVPKGEACLRISLSYAHSAEMIDWLVDALSGAAQQSEPSNM